MHQFACQTKFSCIDRVVFRKKNFSNYPMARANGVSDWKTYKNHFKGCRNGQREHSSSLVGCKELPQSVQRVSSQASDGQEYT